MEKEKVEKLVGELREKFDGLWKEWIEQVERGESAAKVATKMGEVEAALIILEVEIQF